MHGERRSLVLVSVERDIQFMDQFIFGDHLF
jgi:hypothetical protein